ncbi:MAG TPA: fimbrillin family protein [Candidatus Coprenecus pullicola]|nr:fimbrillin family protein [Candidatus Coprenecus pullicola]
MNTRLLPIAVLALCAAACTNDDENLNDDSVAAVINAEISDAVSTRASGTAWAERDEIGISESRFGYTNVPYRWESGKFTPTGTIIFFQDDDPTTFSAYYPYDADGGTLTATTDATAQQNQPAIDFLYATGATASTHNPEVNFRNGNTAGENDPTKDHSFHHCMSQITLTFKEGSGVDFTTIQPTGYTLSGLVLKGSFDTATGTAEADANAQTADLTMRLDGALTSSVILFPQSTTSIELSVDYNSQPYTAMLDIPDGALKAGNNYVWTITVRNKDLSVESAEITAWNKVEDSVNADL